MLNEGIANDTCRIAPQLVYLAAAVGQMDDPVGSRSPAGRIAHPPLDELRGRDRRMLYPPVRLRPCFRSAVGPESGDTRSSFVERRRDLALLGRGSPDPWRRRTRRHDTLSVLLR